MRYKILIFTTVGLLFFFAVILFKNISYPLFWNDEGDTVMRAKTVLKYGKPKVYFEDNLINQIELPDKTVGVKEDGTWVKTPWGQYYYAALFVNLAESFENSYTQTGIIRAPFALIGFAGIIVFGLSIAQLIVCREKKFLYFSFFIFMEIISVSLILYLRNVRSYPITLFILSIIVFTFIRFNYLKKLSVFAYILILSFALILLFITFPPACIPIFAVSGIVVLYDYFKKQKSRKSLANNLLPFVISFLLIIPVSVYFETLPVAFKVSEYFKFDLSTHFSYIALAARLYLVLDFLLLMVAVKVFALILTRKSKNKDICLQIQVSTFLTLLYVFYLIAVARVPNYFDRYFLPIQPVLSLVVLLDSFIIFSVIRGTKDIQIKQNIIALFVFVIILFGAVPFVSKMDNLSKFIYEISHRYQGPMDSVISYIEKSYDNPEELLIATNYSGPVYMYYLGSRVIVGFVGNNIEEDSKMDPDIVILRKGRDNFVETLQSYIDNGNYQRVSFPIYDYHVNNIPELTIPLKHLYKTKYAETENEQLEIYVIQER